MNDCIFCQIVSKEIPAQMVYEDDWTIGVLDVTPRAPGHVMIIPKSHADNIQSLSDELVGKVFTVVKKMTEILNKAFNPQGLTIGINHFNQGDNNPLHVNHLHVHIMPRFEGDGGGPLQAVVNNPPQESLEDIRSKILNVSK